MYIAKHNKTTSRIKNLGLNLTHTLLHHRSLTVADSNNDSLFSLRYSSGAKKKRKSLLYMGVHLLTIKIDFSISITTNKPQVSAVVKDIGKIYKQIKKSEKSPSTNVMFGKEVKDRSSQERSAEKLEIMRQIDMSGVGYMKYHR